MTVERDRQLRARFFRLSLLVSPVVGIIAGIIAAVYRTDMRNQVAFAVLIFCLASLITILVMRAVVWVVRRCVAGRADEKEDITKETGKR